MRGAAASATSSSAATQPFLVLTAPAVTGTEPDADSSGAVCGAAPRGQVRGGARRGTRSAAGCGAAVGARFSGSRDCGHVLDFAATRLDVATIIVIQ